MHSKDLGNLQLDGRVFYLVGEDAYWLDNAKKFFVAKIAEDMRDVNIKTFPKLDSLADIIYPLSSFGFDEGEQLLWVSDESYEAKKDEQQILRQTVQEGIEPYYLVFENVKLLTAAEKKLMTEINCSRLEKSDLLAIIEDICKPYGGIERSAAATLADYTQNEMAKIYLECQKLTSYAEGGRITAGMVEMLVTEDAELPIFRFINSITEGRSDEAMAQLDSLLSKGTPKSFILAALIKQYRRILHCALSPKSNAELAKVFKVKEYAIKKTREIKNIGKVKMKSILDMLIDSELAFKSGRMSESAAFDTAVAKLLAA